MLRPGGAVEPQGKPAAVSVPVGRAAVLLHHSFLDDRGEAVTVPVAALNQAGDDLPDFAKPIVNVGRVLSAELDDLHRVPDDGRETTPVAR